MTNPGSQNKVKFGLKNAHYAVITEDPVTGKHTYGTPKPLRGSVNLVNNPVGERVEFFADDSTYYIEDINNGYDGELEMATIPDEFRVDVLGDTFENGVMYESANQKGNKFALLFEFDGDVKAKRHVIYNCTAARPTVSGSTKTNTKEPQTSTLTFSARPRPQDSLVKADTAGLADAGYNSWYTTVHEKTPTV